MKTALPRTSEVSSRRFGFRASLVLLVTSGLLLLFLLFTLLHLLSAYLFNNVEPLDHLTSVAGLQLELALIVVVALIGAASLISWLTLRALKPIRTLITASERIAQGDLDTPMPRFQNLELQELGQALDTMRVRLRSTLAELQAHSELLDVNVQERTQELETSRDQLRAVLAVAGAVNQSLSLDQTLSTALEKVVDVVAADAAAIHLTKHDAPGLENGSGNGFGNELGKEGLGKVLQSGHRQGQHDQADQELQLAMSRGVSEETANYLVRLRPGEGVGGPAMRFGQPVSIIDITKYRRGRKMEHGDESLRSLAQIPLISKGKVLGVLSVARRQECEFSPSQIELLSVIGGQTAIAIENARLYEALSRREQGRGELLEEVIAAQEEERRRIARELHDETSQSLAALVAAIETTASRAGDPEKVKQSLQRMRTLSIAILEGIHQLIFNLRPTVLDDLGLVAAIRASSEERLAEAGITLCLEADYEERLPIHLETALFRVIQEAVNNVIRHSKAENASIELVVDDSTIAVDVEDDGIGFVTDNMFEIREGGQGLGLMGMKERVALLGGTMSISSQPANGTHLAIRVPFHREGNHDGQD